MTADPETAAGERPAGRRRGEALLEAIYRAVVEELAESGYAGLSIESVAQRARTGKASIYRRWPSRFELVVEALDHALPRFAEAPDTGTLRGDLLAIMREVARAMSGTTGVAARACLAWQEQDPEVARALKERLMPPRQAVLLTVLRRWAERGEVRPEAVSRRIAEVGPMLLHGEIVQRGTPVKDATVRALVDEVLLPLVRA